MAVMSVEELYERYVKPMSANERLRLVSLTTEELSREGNAAPASRPTTQAGRTVGEQILSELEADGVLGLWEDRPEDSIELARELRTVAGSRGAGA